MSASSLITPQYLFALVIDLIALKGALAEGDDIEALFRADGVSSRTKGVASLAALRAAVIDVAETIQSDAPTDQRRLAAARLADSMARDLHVRP